MPKTSILIIAVLFQFALRVNAQLDLVNGAEWQYDMIQVLGAQDLSNTVTIIGDTIIDGQPCKIMENEFWNCNYRPKKDFIYQEDNKVFYYHSQDSAFHILYDYSAEIGDTIAIRNWEPFSNVRDYFYLRIDSISTVIIGSENVKKFKAEVGFADEFGEVSFLDYFFDIIEGAGCSINYFYWYDTGGCDGLHVNKLRCFYHPDFGNYGETTNCSLTSSIGQSIEQPIPFEVYPNPFSDNISITLIEQIVNFNLKLYDITGNLVLTKTYQNNFSQTITLDKLPFLSKGLFHLVIEDTDNFEVFSKRVLKD